MITIDQLVPRPVDLPGLEKGEFPAGEANAPCHPLAPLIIYDDLLASHRARQLIASITHSSEEAAEVRPAFWCFDLLEHPSGRCQALADAADANLLIVSASGQSAFPPPVTGWLKACLAEKQGTGTAVVAVLGSPPRFDGPESPRLRFLKEAALAAGLDFFATGARPEDLHPATFENLHAREEAMTPTLDGILHHAPEISPALSVNP